MNVVLTRQLGDRPFPPAATHHPFALITVLCTGLEVSRICLGCMSYGVPDRGNHAWSIDEAERYPA
jgi:hypothetical protein